MPITQNMYKGSNIDMLLKAMSKTYTRRASLVELHGEPKTWIHVGIIGTTLTASPQNHRIKVIDRTMLSRLYGVMGTKIYKQPTSMIQ